MRAPLIHNADNDWAAWLARAGVPDARPGDGLHVDLSAAAIEAALAGQGVALASVPLVADLLARGLLVEPFGPAQPDPRCYWLSAPEPQWQQKKVRALVAWLTGLQ
ncbi:LysR substrate-binding domain-containing protein [Hankyongella ginsenosidimutans]|uniref:LysR substrate-binding domain-containing protein n=1 Tax=Hankyongella ginsenosidimutans TaxID=1763828 RepID=UPI001CA358D4